MNLADRIKYLALFAWRNALRHRRRSLLVLSTAAVGMTGVLFSMGFSNGMVDSMIRGGVESGMGHTQIRPAGFDQKRKLDEPIPKGAELLKAIGTLEFPDELKPVNYSPRFEREGLLRIGSYQEGVILTGIDASTEKGVSSFDEWIVEGEYLKDRPIAPAGQEADLGIIPCILGRVNAQRMEVELGDYVILTLGNRSSQSVSVRAEIVGIFESPMTGVDRHTVLVRRSDLSHLFEEDSSEISNITFLGPSLEKAGDLDAFLESRKDQLLAQQEGGSNSAPAQRDGNPKASFEILSFFELQPQIETMLNYIEDIKGIIYGVLMSGFALTLLNSVLMSVFERTREIGIQMAIGTRKSFIVVSIILESMILAMGGAVTGLITGGGLVLLLLPTGIPLGSFAGAVEMMGTMTAVIYPRLTMDDILLGFYVALGMSVVAALYPAFKATSIQPVEAISGRK
ncbi:MAG: ABC transporter permease [Leptospiraceae bacterium]|nr:ABC transporter permease [Leptospiraceae bacterium]